MAGAVPLPTKTPTEDSSGDAAFHASWHSGEFVRRRRGLGSFFAVGIAFGITRGTTNGSTFAVCTASALTTF